MNNPTFDDLGSTARDTNIVASQMGFNDNLLLSYSAQVLNNDSNDNRFSQLRTGISYSDNQDVSVVRFGDLLNDGDADLIDMSGRTAGGTYVAFGFAGKDTIVGGPGNNFLYSGPGDDILVGGRGNNLLDGGNIGAPIAGDGTDTADYSGDLGLSGRQGVKITIDPGSAPGKVDGVAPIMVTDNGFGGTDRLVSIEKIKLGGQDDVVTIGPSFGQALNTLLEVDGGGGRNTLDLRQISKDITFRL